MSVAATISEVWSDGKRMHVTGTLTFSGNYATNGDTITWNDKRIKSQTAPLIARIDSFNGFLMTYNPSTKKVLIFGQKPTDGTAGIIALSQYAAGAYSVDVTLDVVNFYAIFYQLK